MRRINPELLILEFESLPDKIGSGHVLENLDRIPQEILIRGIHSSGNRARGMLLSHGARATIAESRFSSPGSAIQIAGDAHQWFESGKLGPVTIRENLFDHCLFGDGWGEATIEVTSPHAEGGEEYYHYPSVTIDRNRFLQNAPLLLSARSVDRVEMRENEIEGKAADIPSDQRVNIRACRELDL